MSIPYEFTADDNGIIRKAGTRTRIWGGIMIVSALLPSALAVYMMLEGVTAAISGLYLLLTLLPIYLGWSFMRAGSELRQVVDTSGSDVSHLLAALDNLSKAFAIQIAVAVVFAVIVATSIAFPPSTGHSRERTYAYAQRGDLRELATSQEDFFHADANRDGQPDGVYAGALDRLPDYTASAGVDISILHADGNGWAARTDHRGSPGKGCAMYIGRVPSPPVTPGGKTPRAADEIVCDAME